MDDNKAFATVVIVMGLLLGGAMFGGFNCERKRTEAITDCMKAGRSPMECRSSVRGTQ